MVGTMLAGRYEIKSQIGIGGMGIVYRAHDTTLKRDVAIKVIAPHLMEDEKARARFLQEARALAGLSHPNIVTIYDLAEEADSKAVFIVMELLRGKSLRRIMDSEDKPAFDKVAIQVCRALECAHANGIMHRDIKPENIFVCSDGAIKLMDFGLARLLGAAATQQSTLVAGTIAYMAPEQLRAEPLDARTDLYALGVLLYEYLSGTTPFAADNPGAILIKNLTEEPTPLSQRLPGLPSGVNAMVMRLLEKDPAARFPSVASLRESLEKLPAGDQPAPPASSAPAPTAAVTAPLPPAFVTAPPIPPVALPSASAIPIAPPSKRFAPRPIQRDRSIELPPRRRSRLGLGLAIFLIAVVAAALIGQTLQNASARQKEETARLAAQKNSKKRAGRARASHLRPASRKTAETSEGTTARKESKASSHKTNGDAKKGAHSPATQTDNENTSGAPDDTPSADKPADSPDTGSNQENTPADDNASAENKNN